MGWDFGVGHGTLMFTVMTVVGFSFSCISFAQPYWFAVKQTSSLAGSSSEANFGFFGDATVSFTNSSTNVTISMDYDYWEDPCGSVILDCSDPVVSYDHAVAIPKRYLEGIIPITKAIIPLFFLMMADDVVIFVILLRLMWTSSTRRSNRLATINIIIVLVVGGCVGICYFVASYKTSKGMNRAYQSMQIQFGGLFFFGSCIVRIVGGLGMKTIYMIFKSTEGVYAFEMVRRASTEELAIDHRE